MFDQEKQRLVYVRDLSHFNRNPSQIKPLKHQHGRPGIKVLRERLGFGSYVVLYEPPHLRAIESGESFEHLCDVRSRKPVVGRIYIQHEPSRRWISEAPNCSINAKISFADDVLDHYNFLPGKQSSTFLRGGIVRQKYFVSAQTLHFFGIQDG